MCFRTGASPESLPRALAHQMDNIKTRYRGELEPLQHQREALMHEINELKEARDIFLEETTALNARNDELAQLNGQIARQIETSIPTSFESSTQEPAENGAPKPGTKPAVVTNPFSPMSKQQHKAVPSPASMSSIGSTLAEERSIDSASSSVGKKFKWFGASAKSLPSLPEKTKRAKQHTFQQQSILRFTRCDHCGDKLWGAQFRCSGEYLRS